MSKSELSKRVKELRARKGLSQEQLAENSGLSLRTIQRIENGETEPRGETLKRLMNALEVAPDDLMDWSIAEDKGFLTAVNLSALGFFVFPLLGILIPLIMWISKKDKLKDINKTGKEILNFQITWNLLVFLTYIFFMGGILFVHSFMRNPFTLVGIIGFLYIYNFVLIIINTVKIYNGNEIKYYPKIRFLR
ncbi:MAG TPA: helix-turn-helix domain-containing protein [Draconibacterium sp.]|nr:helix-turn-helix domain-containing protein [Draconibacterium sp.]